MFKKLISKWSNRNAVISAKNPISDVDYTLPGIERQFDDGSQLIIKFETSGENDLAKRIFYMYLQPLEASINQYVLAKRGLCCEKLSLELDRPDRYPRLSLITPADWQGGRKQSGAYAGATGPGYYEIWHVRGKAKKTEPSTEENVYLRLDVCPYCNQLLAGRFGQYKN